jgi:uncharacterized protein (TIGR02646 family)
MKGAFKGSAPEELSNWLSENNEAPNRSYRNLPSDVKKALKLGMWREQNAMCVYCGKRIEPDERNAVTGQPSVHIEHFKPQKKFPEDDLTFSNLFLSCGPEADVVGICGAAKENWYDSALAIYPDQRAISGIFRCRYDGTIIPAKQHDAKAAEMIKRLNLNHSELKTGRRLLLEEIDDESLKIGDLVDEQRAAQVDYAHIGAWYIGCEITPMRQ